MQKSGLNEKEQNILAVVTFYLIIILGVVAINTRFESINEQTKSADVSEVQTAQNLNS